MTTNLIADRVAQLDGITLDSGSHTDFNDGHCAMEVVAWLAGEGVTDAPACASPVLRRFTISQASALDLLDRMIDPSAVTA